MSTPEPPPEPTLPTVPPTAERLWPPPELTPDPDWGIFFTGATDAKRLFFDGEEWIEV